MRTKRTKCERPQQGARDNDDVQVRAVVFVLVVVVCLLQIQRPGSNQGYSQQQRMEEEKMRRKKR